MKHIYVYIYIYICICIYIYTYTNTYNICTKHCRRPLKKIYDVWFSSSAQGDHNSTVLEKQLPDHGPRLRSMVAWCCGSLDPKSAMVGGPGLHFATQACILGLYGSSVIPKGSILVGWVFRDDSTFRGSPNRHFSGKAGTGAGGPGARWGTPGGRRAGRSARPAGGSPGPWQKCPKS